MSNRIEDAEWVFAAQVAPLYDMYGWAPSGPGKDTVHEVATRAASLRRTVVESMVGDPGREESFASTCRIKVLGYVEDGEYYIDYYLDLVTDYHPYDFIGVGG